MHQPVALAGGTQDEVQVHFYFPEIVRGLGFGWPSCAHLLLAYFGRDKSTIAFFFLYELDLCDCVAN